MVKRMNRKGQDLTVGTLILIVLGVIILVLLVLGFSIGWDKVFGFFGITSASDIQQVITGCNTAASSNSIYDYCTKFTKVKLDSGVESYVNCKYGAVENSLNTKLNCDNYDTAGKDKCADLIKGLSVDNNGQKDCSKFKVNGVSCGDSTLKPADVTCKA